MTPHSTLIPTLDYRDAPAAIEWLCRAFGFEKRMVVPGPEGRIMHAQLTWRGGMLMLASTRSDRTWQTAPESGRAGTQSVVIVVPDADAAHARAMKAGAEMVLPIVDFDHGGRGFSVRDPEGHVWHVGSYDPWAPV